MKKGCFETPVFKALSLSNLDFSLPSTDEQSFRGVLRFADYLGHDAEAKRGRYRLSLAKCATLSPDELGRLARHGIHLSEDVVGEVSRLRMDRLVSLTLQGGDLVITATPGAEDLLVGHAVYEPKTQTYRAKPKDLWDVLHRLEDGCRVNLDLDVRLGLSFQPNPLFRLRPYQARCYDAWRRGGCRGVIALPTAAGKTFLALQAITDLRVRTLIMVPSIDLLHQWRRMLTTHLKGSREHVGLYGGGSREIKDITIITYQSAYLRAEDHSGRFMLLVADEAHHAVAEEFRRVFDVSIARYRMGLTATPLRSDGLHQDYNDIIGPIIQLIPEAELQERGYIAEYEVKKVYVELPPEAMMEYQRNLSVYEEYCRRVLPQIHDPRRRFELCLRYAARDPKARDALRARNQSRVIALSAEKKIEEVGRLLAEHRDRKVLVFSRYVDVVREISRRYLIPLIVAETANEERKAVLDMFRRGEVTKLASGMTLEEGIDVPDAQVGIVISGSGSNREYLQRVGRLLRPKREAAQLIELVTKGTMDEQLSARRRRFKTWPKRGD